jgi:Tol biopolymer transport system component
MPDLSALLESVADVEPTPTIPHEALRRAIARESSTGRGATRATHRRLGRLAAVGIVSACVVAVVTLILIAGHRGAVRHPATPTLFGRTAGWLTVGGDHLRLVDPDHPARERVLPDRVWRPAVTRSMASVSPLDWSPDGSKLLVKRGHGLYVLDQAGTMTRIVPLRLRTGVPIWTAAFTADGTQVILLGLDGSVYRVSASGGRPTRLAAPPGHQVYALVTGSPVSPDGATVVYPHAGMGGAPDGFWLMDSDGSHQRLLVTLAQVRSAAGMRSTAGVNVLGWLPGRRLLLVTSDEKVLHCRALSINADGSDLRPWGPEGLCPWSATPSPDGRLVAVVSGRVDPSRVTVFDPAGAHGRLVPRDLVRPSLLDYVVAWRP